MGVTRPRGSSLYAVLASLPGEIMGKATFAINRVPVRGFGGVEDTLFLRQHCAPFCSRLVLAVVEVPT